MGASVSVNGLLLCHRGDGGLVHNTLPDICKTPKKGVPRPFDNEAYSKDLDGGTTTVYADGGNMVGNFGSIFAASVLNEGGKLGGIKSGTHLAEADFITHSFDVFFEGKPACRHTDKMWMNHRNTASLGGFKTRPQRSKDPTIQKWLCECLEQTKPQKEDGTAKTCMELGTEQHQCMEDKKAADSAQREKDGKKPTHGQEKGYKVKDGKIERVDDIAQRRAEKPVKLQSASTAAKQEIKKQSSIRAGVGKARQLMGGGGPRVGRSSDGLGLAMDAMAEGILDRRYREASEALEKAQKQLDGIEKSLLNPNRVPRHAGHSYPDGSVMDADGKITELSEYKFVCPKGTPTGKTNQETQLPSVSTGTSEGDWSKGQKKKYEDILDAMKADRSARPDAKVNKYSSADCEKLKKKSGKGIKK